MKSNKRRKERKRKMLLSNLMQKKRAVLQFSKILQYHWETGKPIDAKFVFNN
jgi:hypothetical protein